MGGRTLRDFGRAGCAKPGAACVLNEAAWQRLLPALYGPLPRGAVDWEREAVIGVFLGMKPSGGYAVAIEGVRRAGGQRLEVTVRVREPGPGEFVTMVTTFPGHLVRIDRNELPGGPRWQLVVSKGAREALFEIEVEQGDA